MENLNAERMCASEVKPRPYAERKADNLLYLKAALEQRGELVPTDLLAALSAKGIIV